MGFVLLMSVDASVEGMERFGEILGMMWGVEKDEGKLEGVLMRLFWAGLLNGGLGLWLVYGGRSARSLTWWGVWHAAVLGVTLWTCLGMQGWLFCVVFLVCGSWLTRVGKTVKIAEGTYEKRKGARGPENVWGAGLVPALCAMMFTVCSIFPSFSIYAPVRFRNLCFFVSLIDASLLIAHSFFPLLPLLCIENALDSVSGFCCLVEH